MIPLSPRRIPAPRPQGTSFPPARAPRKGSQQVLVVAGEVEVLDARRRRQPRHRGVERPRLRLLQHVAGIGRRLGLVIVLPSQPSAKPSRPPRGSRSGTRARHRKRSRPPYSWLTPPENAYEILSARDSMGLQLLVAVGSGHHAPETAANARRSHQQGRGDAGEGEPMTQLTLNLSC